MFKHLSALMAVAALFAITGCESIAVDEETSVPVAEPDPRGGSYSPMGNGLYNPTLLPGDNSSSPAGAWQDPQALDDSAPGNADADGWVAVDPENRLGMPIIYFAYDSDVLVPSETANLDKIAQYLIENPSLGLVIEGHCDNRGTDEYNRSLSERRANAIRAYLAGKGVPDANMKTVPYGKDKPAVPGTGESIWRQNRRGVPVPMQIPQK